MADKIEPILLPKADQLLNQRRNTGDTLLIITATNRFITEPIAQRLGGLMAATRAARSAWPASNKAR